MSRRGKGVSSSRGPTRIIIGAGVALAIFYFILGYRAHLRNQAILAGIEALRDDLRVARVAADQCTGDLNLARSVFEQTQVTVDSLRAVVNAAEEPLPEGGRGVDAAEYDAYLVAFDQYNSSVEEWEAQAEDVRQRDDECRRLADVHNALVDSLRAELQAHGLAG